VVDMDGPFRSTVTRFTLVATTSQKPPLRPRVSRNSRAAACDPAAAHNRGLREHVARHSHAAKMF